MKPIFRWAGSKRKLVPILQSKMPTSFGKYVEPFCGSACLFFALPEDRPAVLSDINTNLINAYSFIKTSPEEVHYECAKIAREKEVYLEKRAEFNSGIGGFRKAVLFVYVFQRGAAKH